MGTIGTVSQLTISGHNVPLTPYRDKPIRLYLTGATDNSDAEGVYSYILTRRTAKAETYNPNIFNNPEPSALVDAYLESGCNSSLWGTFVSGYSERIVEIAVETARFFINSTEADKFINTANPASGTIVSGVYDNNTERVYLYEDWYWDPGIYYWYYVGARDKSGNVTPFHANAAHPDNPLSGVVTTIPITIPTSDNEPPTGMEFYTG